MDLFAVQSLLLISSMCLLFVSLNGRFWNLLDPFCTVHTSIKKMPFVTSMCRGYGKTASIDGKVMITSCLLVWNLNLCCCHAISQGSSEQVTWGVWRNEKFSVTLRLYNSYLCTSEVRWKILVMYGSIICIVHHNIHLNSNLLIGFTVDVCIWLRLSYQHLGQTLVHSNTSPHSTIHSSVWVTRMAW